MTIHIPSFRFCLMALSSLVVLEHVRAGNIQIQLEYQTETPEHVRTRVQEVADRLESWISSPTPDELALKFVVEWSIETEFASASAGWYWELDGLSVPAACYLGSGHERPAIISGLQLADATITLNRDNPLINQPDYPLDTILIHEILHALGFTSSYGNGTAGEWGMNPRNQPFVRYITPYDALLADEFGNSPEAGETSPPPTSALFLNGEHLLGVRGSGLPIYTPEAYDEGSSITHVLHYSLMQESLSPFTGLHAYETAILEDLGWKINHPSTLRIHGTKPIPRAGPDGTVEIIPYSWHEGDRWGGLPPFATTNVTMESGTSDYHIEVVDGLAQVNDLTIAGSATSTPTLKINTALQSNGTLSIAVPSDTRGKIDINGAALLVGGLLLQGPGSSISATSSYVRAESIFQSGGILRLIEGARLETSLLDLSGGELFLIEDSSAGASSADGLVTRVNGGRLEVQGESLSGKLFEITSGAVDLDGGITSTNTFNFGGGEIRIHGAGSAFNSLNLAGIESRWAGTDLIGASPDASLELNHRNLTLGGSDRTVTNLDLEINGAIRINESIFRLENSTLELNGGPVMNGGTLSISETSDVEINGLMEVTGNFSIQREGAGTIVLNGGIRKSGAESSVINAPTEINGTLEVTQGELSISHPGVHYGTANVHSGATLAIHPDFRSSTIVGGGTIKVLGAYVNQASLTIPSGLSVETTGFTQSSAGTLSGSGTLKGNAELDGRVSPGMSPGTLTITGNVSLLPTCLLAFELGAAPGMSDLLRVADPLPHDELPGGSLTLDGIIDLASSPVVPEGSYTIITYDGTLEDRGLEIHNIPAGFSAAIDHFPGKVVLRLTATSYSSWATTFGLSGANALPDAQPQHDGVANILKYAFGMDPRRPDTLVTGSSGLPHISATADTNSTTFRVEFVRRKNAGLTYTPKSSSELGDASFQPIQGSEAVTILNESWERVVVQEVLQSSQTRRFGLVEVGAP